MYICEACGTDISIHALREEGDLVKEAHHDNRSNFYPRPPRGGRPPPSLADSQPDEFLSTPSARRATFCVSSLPVCWSFLSTPSARRATEWADKMGIAKQFLSTPSARRATKRRACRACKTTNFYPRPPRGGRPTFSSCLTACSGFLSTPSARRATKMSNTGLTIEQISIHALREEGDE